MLPMSTTRSDLRRAEWADPEIRARRVAAIAEGARRRYQDPKQRIATADSRRKWLCDPAHRAEVREYLAQARKARKPTHGMAESSEYRAWDAMISRCTRPSTKQWKDYGGRGIRVCEAWVGRGGFLRFLDHIGPKPSPQHTLGRINNDGNYEPSNVRWETRLEQMANWRRNRMVTIGSETKHVAAWARQIGISEPAFTRRATSWPEERLLEPPHPCGRRRKV